MIGKADRWQANSFVACPLFELIRDDHMLKAVEFWISPPMLQVVKQRQLKALHGKISFVLVIGGFANDSLIRTEIEDNAIE